MYLLYKFIIKIHANLSYVKSEHISTHIWVCMHIHAYTVNEKCNS